MHALSCQLLSILLALGWWRLGSLSGGMHKQILDSRDWALIRLPSKMYIMQKFPRSKSFMPLTIAIKPPFPVNPLAPPPWSVAGLGSTHCGHQNGDVGKSGGLAGCSTRSRHLNNFFPFFGSSQFKGNLKGSGVHRSIQLISI